MTARQSRSDGRVLTSATDEQLWDLLLTELIQLESESIWDLTRQQRQRKAHWAYQVARELLRRSAQGTLWATAGSARSR